MVKVRSVTTVTEQSITSAQIRRSGFDSKHALLAALGTSGTLYRIAFELAPATQSPAITQADSPLTEQDRESMAATLRAMDARTASGPWTTQTLALIGAHPGRRAGDLAPLMDLATPVFKTRVRRLKALGLTRSLETGYRLTDRGREMTRHKH